VPCPDSGSRARQLDRHAGEAIPSQIKQGVARPTGVGRGITTYEIPIEGRDEWLAAAGLGA